MNPRTRALIIVLVIGAIGTVVTLLSLRHKLPERRPVAARPAPAPAPKVITEKLPIGRGDTLDEVLGRAGLDAPARTEMLAAIQGVFDVKKLRAGTEVMLTRRGAGDIESLAYTIDPDHELRLSRSEGVSKAAVVEIPGVVRTVPVTGKMQDSLFDSIARAGEQPELALQVADIFAWDIDFYTDPQPGDEFCLLLEKKEYANGQPPTYRRILGARYNNGGKIHEGYLFQDGGGKPRYYAADGHSLQAAFLRSPMKFEASVSSHFSQRRFHPVLKIFRPHLGTDYAAPVGMPVQAIAPGTVTFSARSGASGNMIRIRHANGYESLYLHLSRMLVRAGQRVEQGQRIGLVGATGVVTGPHLDFRLSRNGRFVNFEQFRPPRATKLEGQQMAAFAADRDRFAALMNSATTTVAQATTASRVDRSN